MELWAWGANNYGQLGIGITNEQCGNPVQVSMNFYFFTSSIEFWKMHLMQVDWCPHRQKQGSHPLKAVGHLIPFMEKEKEQSVLEMKAAGTWNENVLIKN